MNTKARNQIFNIGNDKEPITIKELAQKTINKVNPRLKTVCVPFEESDRSSLREIYYRVPNINKVRKSLNYSPSITLDDGLEKVIAFERERVSPA